MPAGTDRVTLHVGTMKSGTSYLQALLFAEKPRLAAAGVLVPGADWGVQSRGIQQAIGNSDKRTHVWDPMVADIVGHDGPTLISMEYLGPVRAKKIGRIVGRLGGDVDVVFTLRDLNRTLVSMWQETVQNGRSWTWDDYHAEAAAAAPGTGDGVFDRDTAGGTFWRQQSIVRMVREWGSVVGPERITVVTVPPPGADRSELARRFGAATDVDFGADPVVPVANESLGLASILALRRLNELLDEAGLAYPAAFKLRKKILAKTVLAARKRDEGALGLPVQDWVVAQTRDTISALQDCGVRLVGDWADLEPVAVPGAAPADVPDADVTEAALAGLAGLIAHVDPS